MTVKWFQILLLFLQWLIFSTFLYWCRFLLRLALSPYFLHSCSCSCTGSLRTRSAQTLLYFDHRREKRQSALKERKQLQSHFVTCNCCHGRLVKVGVKLRWNSRVVGSLLESGNAWRDWHSSSDTKLYCSVWLSVYSFNTKHQNGHHWNSFFFPRAVKSIIPSPHILHL